MAGGLITSGDRAGLHCPATKPQRKDICIYNHSIPRYLLYMSFEWDPDKDEANRAKHGVGFGEAQEIFDQPRLVRQDTRQDYGEV